MNNNISNNYAIDYDPDILVKIKKMIKEGFEKLKSFVKSRKESKFQIYYELEEKFNDISNILRNKKIFENEFKFHLLIKSEILYIVYRNCENPSFDHCNFALELFDFFIEIWDAKNNLFENFSELELKTYEKLQNTFKERYHKYRREFYCNIYEYSDDFNEKEMYEFAKSLRG